MNAGWKVMLLSVVVFGVTFGAERIFVPDIVPVAFADEPQALWALETAFMLRAIELMAAGAAIIALILMFGSLANNMWRGRLH